MIWSSIFALRCLLLASCHIPVDCAVYMHPSCAPHGPIDNPCLQLSDDAVRHLRAGRLAS